MFSQNKNNKYVVYNYVYNNSVRVLNMNNPGNDGRSRWWRISSNDDNEGDFIKLNWNPDDIRALDIPK